MTYVGTDDGKTREEIPNLAVYEGLLLNGRTKELNGVTLLVDFEHAQFPLDTHVVHGDLVSNYIAILSCLDS